MSSKLPHMGFPYFLYQLQFGSTHPSETGLEHRGNAADSKVESARKHAAITGEITTWSSFQLPS